MAAYTGTGPSLQAAVDLYKRNFFLAVITFSESDSRPPATVISEALMLSFLQAAANTQV